VPLIGKRRRSLDGGLAKVYAYLLGMRQCYWSDLLRECGQHFQSDVDEQLQECVELLTWRGPINRGGKLRGKARQLDIGSSDMTSGSINPFRPTRWEHHTDGRPLIWFTEEAEELSADKVDLYSRYPRDRQDNASQGNLLGRPLLQRIAANAAQAGRLQEHWHLYPLSDHISASMSFTDWAALFPRCKIQSMNFIPSSRRQSRQSASTSRRRDP
jgi:hypothetical protein